MTPIPMTPIPILLYHSVGHTTAPAYRQWCIEPSLFDEHLSALASSGYDCLTVSGLVDAIDTATLPACPLVVTFDDGRADFAENAVPLLARYGIPSTMYVVSSHVGGTSAWLGIPGESDQPMLSWSDLGAAVAAGHEIGAHSQTHPELDIVSRRRSEAEIRGSRRELEDGLGHAVRSFAYPHGYYRSRDAAAVAAAGYDSGCTVGNRWSWPGEDRRALSRLNIDGDVSAEQLLARLAAPPTAPEKSRRVLRRAWRYTRWLRHHRPRLGRT